MTRSVYIEGPHHVLHNCTEGFERVVRDWKWFTDLLKAVCALLSARWSSDRLIQTCYASPPANSFAGVIANFNFRVYDKRWGTVYAGADEVLQRKRPLRLGWNKARYLGGMGVAAPRGDADGDGWSADAANIGAVDEVIGRRSSVVCFLAFRFGLIFI